MSNLLLIGCGKMGGALLECAVSHYTTIYVIDPSARPIHSVDNVTCLANVTAISSDFTPDLVVIAVKPQQLAEVLPAYKHYAAKSVFLSIAAGVTLQKLETLLGPASIVRSMPNLPASVGQGISALVANVHANLAQKKLAEAFLGFAGATLWLNDEKLINAVTALSGSGPAYIYAFCEAMAAAGTELGLTPQQSMLLARQTLIGSASLLDATSQELSALRQAVTSPGGTTEAALKTFAQNEALAKLVEDAMRSAAKRAEQLAG